MAVSLNGLQWHTPFHYFPIPAEHPRNIGQATSFSNQKYHRMPHALWSDKPSEPSDNNLVFTVPKPYVRVSTNEGATGRNQKIPTDMFEWETNDISSSRGDDGVVLLVGLFNLLAVIVYASQEFLFGDREGKDQRIILWQVQKVLDELVLRVHSSDSAANLISRAFKTSARSPSLGRSFSSDTTSSVVEHMFQEDDPLKLQKWLDEARNDILVEISKSPYTMKGAKINAEFYRPLQKLYSKITKTTRTGRSFSTSLLQEISSTARTASQLSIEDFQNILKLVTNLGRMRRRYDIIPLLQSYLPSKRVVSDHGTETIYNFPSRSKRSSSLRERSSSSSRITRRQRKNSRYPRLSDALIPLKIKEHSSPDPFLMKRQGSVENIHPDYITTANWADKWFSLLTQISPIALDFTTLYTSARSQPSCLRSLLCKSNNYWRKKGTLQAAITPFLSVVASWAMEGTTPHSLGDSLIAIRAGWMEKDCFYLYSECQTGALSTQPSFTTFELRSPLYSPTKKPQQISGMDLLSSMTVEQKEQKARETQNSQKTPVRESKNEQHGDELINKDLKLPFLEEPSQQPHRESEIKMPQINLESREELNDLYGQEPTKTLSQFYKKGQKMTNEETEEEVALDYTEKKPYDRYDNPNTSNYTIEMLPSGSVSGMALQDRPLESYLEAVQKETIEERTPTKKVISENRPVDSNNQEIHYQSYTDNSPPDYFKGTIYSDYMKSQNPNIPQYSKPSSSEVKRPNFLLPQAKQTARQDNQQRRTKNKNEKIKLKQRSKISPESKMKSNQKIRIKHPKVMKYKYGVRRGLPAGNVDGLEQLSLPERLVPPPPKKAPKELRNRYLRQRFGGKENKKPRPHRKPLHEATEFELRDAITDEHKNNILYQYIRDRKVRHIPML